MSNHFFEKAENNEKVATGADPLDQARNLAYSKSQFTLEADTTVYRTPKIIDTMESAGFATLGSGLLWAALSRGRGMVPGLLTAAGGFGLSLLATRIDMAQERKFEKLGLAPLQKSPKLPAVELNLN